MDRKLVVKLLKKNIQELDMITVGFMEMTEYPAAIIQLARHKTEDILEYIEQLENMKSTSYVEECIQQDKTLNEPEEENTDIADINFSEIHTKEEQNVDKDIEVEFEISETQEENIVEEIVTENTDLENKFEISEEELPANEGSFDTEENKDTFESPVEVELEKITTTEIYKTTIEEKITVQPVDKEKNTIADTHNNKKIEDIRHAISIGDRFRFQRELFNGNGEVLNKTLSYLNQLNNFEEAQTYLQNKFKWNEEDETVENFYQIVKRRYL